MEISDEKACLCALNKIFGFTPKIALALLSHLGNASEIFRLGSDEIDGLLGPYSKHKSLITWKSVEEARTELMKLQEQDIKFIGWTESTYPSLLHECEDAPVGLYVRSITPMEDLWKPMHRIAIVGTRDISPYGREWCVRTVTGLAQTAERPVIVSGLALGTDFCAHKAALEYGLATIGVMATGPDSIYPYRHRQFAERLYRAPGCALITDYPPGTAPLAIHFLRRNRIIAGLSDATILIESKIKGGGMMTCRLAFSYSRDVYALPGRADDIRSQGCNDLIKNKIAEPITSIPDLTESLGIQAIKSNRQASFQTIIQKTYAGRLPANSLAVMNTVASMIEKTRGITVGEIADRVGYSYSSILKLISMLEIDGYISIDLQQRCFMTMGKFR